MEIDLDVVCEIGLEDEDRHMLNAGAWTELFMIMDNTYEQLALEVLATFELSNGTIAFHHGELI